MTHYYELVDLRGNHCGGVKSSAPLTEIRVKREIAAYKETSYELFDYLDVREVTDKSYIKKHDWIEVGDIEAHRATRGY